MRKIKTLIELFHNEAAILIEDEGHINYFSIDSNSGILKLMIGFVYNLLTSSSRVNNNEKNLNFLNKINNDNNENENDHFWLFFEKFHENDNCIIFINSLKTFQTFDEKAYIWILLEFSEQNIDSIFQKISQTKQLKEFYKYKENVLLTNYLNDAIDIFSGLKKINYKLNFDICYKYKSYLRRKSLEKTTMILSDYFIDYSNTEIKKIELIKKQSLQPSMTKSNLSSFNRKYSHQPLIIKPKHILFPNFLPLNNKTIDPSKNKSSKSVKVNPFHSFSMNLNLNKQRSVLFELKNTFQTLSSLNQEVLTEINCIKEDILSKSNKTSSSKILNSYKKIEVSFTYADESFFVKNTSKSLDIEEENRPKNHKKINLNFFTPKNEKKKILAQISIEKNLFDLTNSLEVKTVESESVKNQSIISIKKKKNSERLFEEIYLSLNNNDLKFQDKPLTNMKVD